VRDLGLHRFEQRKSTIATVLDHIGEVEIVDAGRLTRDRALRFEVRSPGHGLKTLATFIYAEWYHRVARGWRLTRYHYDYIDRRARGRLAYHWHAVGRRRDVYHAHCEERLGTARFEHYRAYELDLLEAHADFVTLFASDQLVECSGLRPLSTAMKT